MNHTRVIVALAMLTALGVATAAQAQPSALDYRWSFDAGLGLDNSFSGTVNADAIGTLDGRPTVITANSYSDLFGRGFHVRFGGGFLIDEISEVRAVFTYQSLDADLTPMGDVGGAPLYGQYDQYKSLGIEVGFRRYFDMNPTVRPYVEGSLGLGFVSEIDVVLSAPAAGIAQRATDFYDRTTAFSLGGAAGVLWQVSERVGTYGQIGLRRLSGLSGIDSLAGTGLETINDDSARWTLPIAVGVRVRF
jgi:hypothetical protein